MVQERNRAWVPPPHFTGHTPQSLHLVHFPSTENVYKKIMKKSKKEILILFILVMLNPNSVKLKLYLFLIKSEPESKTKERSFGSE